MGNTAQSVEIEKFMARHKHSDAFDIFLAVKKKLNTVTKATVYRNLEKLRKNKKITKFEINGKSYYEKKMRDHCHLICTTCGKIREIAAPAISEQKGFKVCEINIILKGVCRKCNQDVRT